MANDYFQFQQFTIKQDRCAFKVGTDGVLLGAFICDGIRSRKVKTILDIGTGTGLIALMAAQESDAVIYAIEPDKQSFNQAVENFNDSKWSERIKPYNCFLQTYHPEEKFDLIVTNPPYFSKSLHNPDKRLANARHNDSLPFEILISRVHDLLCNDGRFQLILPYSSAVPFVEMAYLNRLYCNRVLNIKATPKSDITRCILDFSHRETKPNSSCMTIETVQRHLYSEEYIALTKNFYLFLQE